MSATNASGVAAVTSLSATVASWIIYNPQGNTVTAFFDRLAATNQATAAGTTGGALWACLVKPNFCPSTIPVTSATNVTINNANPTSAKLSQLIVASGVTLQNTGVGNWFPLACVPANSAVAALVDGDLLDTGWDLRGRIAVPPGCGLALQVVRGAGSYSPMATWHEYASDIE